MGFPSVSQISRPVGRRCCEMLLKLNVFAVSVCKSVCVCAHSVLCQLSYLRKLRSCTLGGVHMYRL